jgi:hypothetical protein
MYQSRAVLNANCAGDGILPGNLVNVPLQDTARVSYLLSKDAVCLFSIDTPLVLILRFSGDELRLIEVSYIRVGK